MRLLAAFAVAFMLVAPSVAQEEANEEYAWPEYTVSNDLSALPEPVRKTREALIAAALSGDIEALRPIVKAQQHPPTVSYGGPDDAVDYLKKPFDPDEFREVVDRVMRKKGLLRSPEENLHRVIGETVRNLRKEANLTLKQMARRTGLSVSLLSQIERAESSASISSLYKIAVALDVKIQDLFGNN